MSEERLDAIERALREFRMDDARALIDEELAENPDAAVFYLASLAARNHGQRVEYLRKTLELDPDHARAREELDDAAPPDAPAKLKTAAADAPDSEAADKPRLASLTRRFGALVVDACIVLFATTLIVNANDGFAPLSDALNSVDEVGATAVFRHFQRASIVVSLLLSAVYQVAFMVALNGQTPGKMMYGMRVARQDGRRITALDAITRNVIGYALSQALLLGYLWAYLDEDQQAWHDKMAGTIVIDEPEKPTSESED